MDEKVLERLTVAAGNALNAPQVSRLIKRLKRKILKCDEPLIWEVLPERLVGDVASVGIMSGWVFVLKSECQIPVHFHPNSVQYTAVIEGIGRILIGEKEEEIQLFDLSDSKPFWYVIGKGVSHGVVTGKRPVVVVSFHTCPSDELLEVETRSGRRRLYVKVR